MEVLFGSMLALLDIVFFVFAFSLLAFAVVFVAFSFYVIRAFIRSERRV
jgi:hypothetical protein